MEKEQQKEMIKEEIKQCDRVIYMNRLKERFWMSDLVGGNGNKHELELKIGQLQNNIKSDERWQGFLEAELGSPEMNTTEEKEIGTLG